MCVECSGRHRRRIAARLHEVHGWEPVCWAGTEVQQSEVRERLPAAVYHFGVDAEAVRRLLAAVASVGVAGCLEPDLEVVDELDEDTAVASMCAAPHRAASVPTTAR